MKLYANSKMSALLGAMAYFILFNIAYVFVVSTRYAYMGFINNGLSLWLLIISFLYFVSPLLWMSMTFRRPSQIAYWLLYIIVYCPSVVVPYYVLTDFMEILILHTTLLMSLYILYFPYKLPLIKFPKFRMSRLLFWGLIGTLSGLFYFYIIFIFGLHLSLVSLKNVYIVRSQYKLIAFQHSRFIFYFVGWLSNVINPLFISLGLAYKKYRYSLIGIIGQFFIYSFTGFKSVFFSVLLLIGVLIVLKLKSKFFGFLILWGTSALILLSIISNKLLHSQIFSSLVLQRILSTPGLLTGYYFDFFSMNPKSLLSYSIFKRIVENPYQLSPPYIIGRYYFNNPDMSANANVWADAYSNFGIGGILFFSIILAIILWIYDSVSKTKDIRFASLMLTLPAFTLTNTGVLTTLLTFGLGFTIILVYVIPYNKEEHI